MFRILCLGSIALFSCGDGGPRDVRVALPEPDPSFIDLVTPEVVLEVGEERMFCLHIDNDRGEFVTDLLDVSQGAFGHHAALLTTLDPMPAGTLEDCTDESTMWKYSVFVLPGLALPAGHGIRVPADQHYVFQFHYINTGDEPIVVRDVARLRMVDASTIEHWVAAFSTNLLDFEIPARTTGQEVFDCVIENDTYIIAAGGHMHDIGDAFELEVGMSEETMAPLYQVDAWRPDFRDAPPVNFYFDDPLLLPAGSILRTRCAWDNTADRPVRFPEEMCSAFGYIRGLMEPLRCSVGEMPRDL